MMFDYFYGNGAEQFSFYRIPRLLIKDKRFKKLSSDAKILYGLMLDRVSLSMKNGWIDEQGRAYIYFTVDDVMEELCCARATSVKIIGELDAKKGIGLIEKKRQGLGRPDIIYVKDFSSGEDDSLEEASETPEVQKLNFKKFKKHTSGSSESELQEVQSLKDSKFKKYTSRSSKTELAEVQDVKASYNNNNQTNMSQNESIHPSIEPDTRDEMDGLDGSDRSGPVEGYMDLIRRNIEYEHYMATGEIHERELVEELYQLICDIVCVRRETVRIGGEEYPYELVKSRFLKIRQPHIEYVMEVMKKTTSKIHDIRSYLITALYRAPDTMNHYYQQEVNHDFYGREEKGIL